MLLRYSSVDKMCEPGMIAGIEDSLEAYDAQIAEDNLSFLAPDVSGD